MDKLQGVSSTSIQKIPPNLDLDEYNLGITINSYILKICQLDINKYQASVMELLKKFIDIGRGVDRLRKGNAKINTHYITGEIYLNLIKFINTNRNNPQRKILINGKKKTKKIFKKKKFISSKKKFEIF